MPALDQWETFLSKQMDKREDLRFLSELGLNRAQIDDIAEGVRAALRRNGFGAATDLLVRRRRHVFAALLAGFSAFNIEGDFWGAFGDYLGVRGRDLMNFEWHHGFMDFIREHNLPHFPPDETAMPYVKTIRLHGGIPAYSLPDFFERMLLPSIQRPDLRGIPSDRVLKALVETVNFVDQPVIQFFQNSGEHGLHIFDACRKMAKHYLDSHGELLPAAQLDLPEYIVQAFGDFMERGTESGGLRLRRPLLLFAPFREEAYLWVKLPEEEIPLSLAGGSLEWRVEWPGLPQPKRIACHLRRQRQSSLIIEELMPISAAPERVTAQLISIDSNGSERLLQRWFLPAVPPHGSPPILAFTAANGRQIRFGQTLPQEGVILVYPIDVELEPDGQARIVESYGRMTGAWSDWKSAVWDLTQAWSIRAVKHSQDIGRPWMVSGRQPEPEFYGGKVCPFTGGPGEPDVYIGAPPILKVPLRGGGQAELPRWRFSLNSVWDAFPEVNLDRPLDQLLTDLQVFPQSVLIDLKKYLGEQPVGTYTLRILGPDGMDTSFRFRCWPEVTLDGLDFSGLPAPAGRDDSLSIRLTFPNNAECEAQSGAGDIRVLKTQVGAQIDIPHEVSKAAVNLVWNDPAGKKVRVPVTIPIPRIRWAVVMGQATGELDWGDRLLQRSAQAFLQTDGAALHIDMYGLGRLFGSLQIELIDLDTGETVQESTLERTPFSSDWLRVSLGRFTDTLRTLGQGRIDLVQRNEGQGERRISLVQFNPDLNIYNVDIVQRDEQWYLVWDEDVRLKNRRVLLKPAWQPWKDAFEILIPDDAQGEFLLENFVPTRYLVHFRIAPPWDEPLTDFPSDGIVDRVDPIPAFARVKILHQPGTDPVGEYCKQFELACIFHDLEDAEDRDNALNACKQYFNHLPQLTYLIGLIDWLEENAVNEGFRRYVWKYLFKPAVVKAALERLPVGNPYLERYLRYAVRATDMYGESAFLIANKAEDPAVIFACLNHLLRHESEYLILTIADMIAKARLAETDAIDLLGEKLEWSLKTLDSLTADPISDRLIAGLLESSENIKDVPEDLVFKLLARTGRLLRDNNLVMIAIMNLIDNRDSRGFDLLFEKAKDGKFTEKEVEKVLFTHSKEAFQFLETKVDNPFYSTWYDRLINRFPTLAGLIRPGYRLQFGNIEGRVQRILDVNGRVISSATSKDRGLRIEVLLRTGEDSAMFEYNTATQMLKFLECSSVVKCGNCDFRHPVQRAVMHHIIEKHQFERHVLSVKQPNEFFFPFDRMRIISPNRTTGQLRRRD